MHPFRGVPLLHVQQRVLLEVPVKKPLRGLGTARLPRTLTAGFRWDGVDNPGFSGSICWRARKTKAVYCKDDDRRGNSKNESFDFLRYSFRARRSKNRFGKFIVNFSPAVSNAATKANSGGNSQGPVALSN